MCGTECGVWADVHGGCHLTSRSRGGEHTIGRLECHSCLYAHFYGYFVVRPISKDEDVLACLDQLARSHRGIHAVKKGKELGAQVSPPSAVANDSYLTAWHRLDRDFVPQLHLAYGP